MPNPDFSHGTGTGRAGGGRQCAAPPYHVGQAEERPALRRPDFSHGTGQAVKRGRWKPTLRSPAMHITKLKAEVVREAAYKKYNQRSVKQCTTLYIAVLKV